MKAIWQCIAVFLTLAASAGAASGRTLKVADDGRHLVDSDGRPFFWLGDTAWELFHRLDREEAAEYLENRAAKGFTVIQAVVLAQLDGLTKPNPYGATPLLDKDPTRPNEAYFEHVDLIVNRAENLGLFVGMLPTWGSYWSQNNPTNVIFTPENARRFGEFLGRRYRDKPIVWILGGDHNIHKDSERAVIEAMAAGLRAGDGGRALITFHPRGPGCSSDYFHTAKWLDFNMIQSSHGAHDHDNGLFVEHDYGLTPAKPTVDGEPRYEALPVGFYFDGFNRLDRFDDYDVRQAAYWAMLAGACGHTYGHGSIWQMYKAGGPSVLWASVPWREAMDHPGAFQMGLMRKLFESRSWQRLTPRQSIILDGPRTGGGKVRAAVADDGSFAFVYSPAGERFTIDRRWLKTDRVNEIWFDPRYGIANRIHTADTQAMQTYTPPTQGRGCDWVLVIEDAHKNYPMPGY